MRLEYITPKKDYNLKSDFIFNNELFLVEAEEIMKISTAKRKQIEIKKLLKKYNVDKSYAEEVSYFIENKGWHSSDHAFDKDGLVIQIPETKEPLDHYFLRVGPNTKLKDLEEAFNMMQDFRDKKVKRNRKKVYPERDMLIFNMAKNGLPWEDIRGAVFEKFEQNLYETNIRTIVTDMCNKLDVPKNERPTVFSKKIRNK